MNKLAYLLCIVLGTTLSLQATTRADIKVIEASENIRYLSQKITKDYLHLHIAPHKKSIYKQLKSGLKLLEDNIRIIATTTKDSDAKGILDYLAYSKDNIKKILDKKIDQSTLATMLEHSNTLLEGANFISDAHRYNFTPEENMLIVTKNIEYLLERISKYYIALQLKIDKKTQQKELTQAIKDFELLLKVLNQYKYPLALQSERTKINSFWKTNQVFLKRADRIFLPNLLIESFAYLENAVAKIELYHSKNQ